MLDFTLKLLTTAQRAKFIGIVERWDNFFDGNEIKTFTSELADVMGCRSNHVIRNLELISKRLNGRLVYTVPPIDDNSRECNDPFYEEKNRKGGRRRPRLIRFRWQLYT